MYCCDKMPRWKHLKREMLAHCSKSGPSWWKPRKIIIKQLVQFYSQSGNRAIWMHICLWQVTFVSLPSPASPGLWSVPFTVLTSHLSVTKIASQTYPETHLSSDSVSAQLTVNTNHHRGFCNVVDEIILFVKLPPIFIFL